MALRRPVLRFLCLALLCWSAAGTVPWASGARVPAPGDSADRGAGGAPPAASAAVSLPDLLDDRLDDGADSPPLPARHADDRFPPDLHRATIPPQVAPWLLPRQLHLHPFATAPPASP